MTNIKKWSIMAAIAIALIAILGTVTLTKAQSPQDNGDNSPRQEEMAQPRNKTTNGNRNDQARGPAHQSRPPRDGFGGFPFATIADTLGMTEDEVQTELENGKTIADLAAEHNVALDTIVDAMVAPMEERIQTAVDNGRMTQAEAAEHIQTMRENIAEQLSQTWDPSQRPMPPENGLRDHGRGHGPQGGHTQVLSTTADILGISVDDVTTELENGKTIADLAAEHNVDLDIIIDDIAAPMVIRLQTAVAEGRLTQDEADAQIEAMYENITERLNQTWDPSQRPMPPENGQRDHGRGHGPQGGHTQVLSTTADILGITVEDVTTELENGKTIADLATEHNIDLDTIVDALVAPMKERLQAAVEDGKITQAEADEKVQTMRENTAERLNQPWNPEPRPMNENGGNVQQGGFHPGQKMNRGKMF